MGAFGAASPKKTIFCGNPPWLEDFGSHMMNSNEKRMLANDDVQVTKQYKTKEGKKGFTAGKDMKGSQSYPAGLGVGSGLKMQRFLPLEFPTDEVGYAELSESDVSDGTEYDCACLDDCLKEATP